MLAQPILHDPADLPAMPKPTPPTNAVDDERHVGCLAREDGYDALTMEQWAAEIEFWNNAVFYEEDADGTPYEVETPSWLAHQREAVARWRARTG